jgi:hypothetical protein
MSQQYADPTGAGGAGSRPTGDGVMTFGRVGTVVGPFPV